MVTFAVSRVALMRRRGVPGGALALTATLEMAVSFAVSVAFGLVLLGGAGGLPGGLAIRSLPRSGWSSPHHLRWRDVSSLRWRGDAAWTAWPRSADSRGGIPAHDRGIGLLLDLRSCRVLPVHARI